MKKIIAIIVMLALLTLCACTQREEVSRELIDYDFTPAHSETEVHYHYTYIGDTYTSIPYTTTEWYSDKYCLKYRVTYDDGSTRNVWENVTEREYDNAVKELGE